MDTQALDPRRERGLVIARSFKLRRIVDGTWFVPSQTHSGGYVVDTSAGTCGCPDHELHRREGQPHRCKHIWAVEYSRHRVTEPDGTVVTDTMRVTYTQLWPQYNAAQCSERDHVEVLLRTLCDQLETQPQTGPGRPRIPLGDVVFAAGIKAYTGLSGRRATSDLRQCAKRGLMDQAPSYNSIFQYMESESTTPVLRQMVQASAVPLNTLEQEFAIDATGFSGSTYRRWYDAKYGRQMKEATWVKLHAVCGVRSSIITAADVTPASVNDSPLLPQLLGETAEHFDVRALSGDKAYLSRANLQAIESVGAKPFVAFKTNSRGQGPDPWKRAYHFFSFHREAWLERYHKRSKIEGTFSALKRLFGASVRAKTETAMKNEVLVKCVVYNTTRLVHAFYELGVDPMETLRPALGETG